MKTKASEVILREFDTIRDAMISGVYDAFKRNLDQGERNYSDLIIGNYQFLFPVDYISYSSFDPRRKKGWMVKNIKTNKFKILSNLNVSNLFIKNCSDASYFGMDYFKADMSYNKFNIEQFGKILLFEIGQMPEKNKIQIKSKKRYKKDFPKYLENIENNLSYFYNLDSSKFRKEVDRIVKEYHFFEVKNISSFKNCLYLIVLDEYKQFYIGKSEAGLKNRMRKHWTAKIVPATQTWRGGFDYSRIKFDNFKMFDATRIFVCTDYQKIIDENMKEAMDINIEQTNLAGFQYFELMNNLEKAERIVINNSKCMFTLSDRISLTNSREYAKLCKEYKTSVSDILVKQYLRLDKKAPLQRSQAVLKLIKRNKK